MSTPTVAVRLDELPPSLLRLLACKVLLLETQARMGDLPESCRPGMGSLVALLEGACRSLAPCAAEYALGVVMGAAAAGESGRLEDAPGATLVERMQEAACPKCAAALAGQTSSAQGHEGTVH